METNVLVFGQITDITGENHIKISGVADTNGVIHLLHKTYPKLQSLEYSIAVNKKIIRENTPLKNNDTVAILPPFSGG